MRYRENALGDSDEIHSDTLPEHKPHEGSDGGKPQVTRADGVAARLFQMIEKGQDGCRSTDQSADDSVARETTETIGMCRGTRFSCAR